MPTTAVKRLATQPREDLQALALQAYWACVERDEDTLAEALEALSEVTGRSLEDLSAHLAQSETSEAWLAYLGVGELVRLPDGTEGLILFDGSEMCGHYNRRGGEEA